MTGSLADISQSLVIVAPDPSRITPFRHLVPDAQIVPLHELEQNTHNQTQFIEQILDTHTKLVILINWPPLNLADIIAQLRVTTRGQQLYLIVVSPPEIPPAYFPDLDIDDYIYVPSTDSVDVLLQTAYARYCRNTQLQEQFVSATRTAQSALKSAAEYGSLIHFFDISEQCQTLETLADAVLEFLRAKQLVVLFCIHNEAIKIYRPGNHLSDSHRHLLEQLAQSGRRIVSVDRLLGFHFKNFTLLITNAPIEQPECYGQLKDSIAHFCALVESRIKNLMVQERIANQHEEVLTIMQMLRDATEESVERTKHIMQGLCQDIELAASTFDMNMQEEQNLLGIAHQAIDNLDQLHENDMLLESHFLNLIATMTSVLNLISTSISPSNTTESVELF